MHQAYPPYYFSLKVLFSMTRLTLMTWTRKIVGIHKDHLLSYLWSCCFRAGMRFKWESTVVFFLRQSHWSPRFFFAKFCKSHVVPSFFFYVRVFVGLLIKPPSFSSNKSLTDASEVQCDYGGITCELTQMAVFRFTYLCFDFFHVIVSERYVMDLFGYVVITSF